MESIKKLVVKGILSHVLLALACINLYAQSASLIPREVLFKGEQKHSLKLSPSGDILYYRTSKQHDKIFALALYQKSKPMPFSISPGLKSWLVLDEGILLCYGNRLLFRSIGGSLTEIIFQSQEESYQIAIDKVYGDKVVVSISNTSGTQWNSINIQDLEVKGLDMGSMPAGGKPFFNTALKPIAATVPNTQGGNDIIALDSSGNHWNTLAQHPFTEDFFLGGFSKVLSVSLGSQFVYYTSNSSTDKTQLYRHDRYSDTSLIVAQHPKVDLLPFGYSTTPNGSISSIVGLYAQTERVVTELDYLKDFRFLEEKLNGDVSYVTSDKTGNLWLIRALTGGPSKIYLYKRNSQELIYLMNDYNGLDSYKMATRKSFEVTTRDGHKLPIHVYLPPGSDKDMDGKPDKPLPTILYVHGGPWVGVVHWNQHFHWRNFQLLANRGYAVINCEFRGGTGLGKKMVDLSNKAWGTHMTNDKADIAQWAIKEGISLRKKIGIWGWSYGGYAAMAGLAFHPDVYACGIGMYGISNLQEFCKLPFADNNLWRNRVGNPSTNDSLGLFLQSPINYVGQIQSPLLLTTGSKDKRVPQNQLDQMATSMRQSGKEVIYFYYPDEVHDYQDPESWTSFWTVAEQFLAQNLGGRYEPVDKRATNNYTVVEGKAFMNQLE